MGDAVQRIDARPHAVHVCAGVHVYMCIWRMVPAVVGRPPYWGRQPAV